MKKWTSAVRVTCGLALVIGAVPAMAKPKVKIFSSNCDRVWAAVKVATGPPHYNFAQLDDTQKKGIVSTGNSLTDKRYLDITLTSPTPTSCSVAVGGEYSGLLHDDKGDLFARIADALLAGTTTATK